MKYIITLSGGLGNQMMQYALFLFLKSKGYKCILYCKLQDLKEHNGLEINKIFSNIEVPKTHIKLIDFYISHSPNIQKLQKYLKSTLKIKSIDKLSRIIPYQIVNFPTWENYIFIDEIKQSLRNTYVFPELIDIKDIELYGIIKSTNSVSIHIRRGDYIDSVNWRCILGDICNKEYYQSAILKALEFVDNPLFFIFSDDIGWTISNLVIPNGHYVDWNKNERSFRDIQLMSLCKHNIISNSTFSLIGAWLNKNENKIVISPSKWKNCYNDQTYLLYIPQSWIIINNDRPNVSIILSGIVCKRDINNILKQSYSDFEILIEDEIEELRYDNRIKFLSESTITGNHVFTFDNITISNFSNRKYLRIILGQYFEKLKVSQ